MNKLFFTKTRRFFSLSLLLFTFIAVVIQINIFYLLLKEDIISISFSGQLSYRATEIIVLLIVFAVFSSIISIFLATYVNSKILDPLEKLSEAMQYVVDGDLNVRVTDRSPIEEVNGLFENFNRMVQALQQNEETSKQMIENITHEMKTPLSVIRGYAQVLETELEDSQSLDMLHRIESSASHLSKMTQQMTQLTKLENQTLNLPMLTFNLSEQMRQVVLEFQDQWEAKNLDLDIDIDDISYQGNEEYLYHVWRNLIENAIKYNHPQGILSIKAHDQQKGIQIEVTNSGANYSEEEIRSIGQRFYQTDTSRLTDGTGLGVPIAKKIIELHQGTFEMRNPEPNVISVIIYLPKN